MAEDSPGQPLPRRVSASNRHVPGNQQGRGARPVRQAALSEDALQRIRAALDSVRNEASPEVHAPRVDRSASLPRRVPGAGKGPQPPAVIAGPRLSSLPHSRADEASTEEFPALSVSYSGGDTAEIRARPDAQPEPDAAPPAELPQAPAPRPPAQQQGDRQDRTDGATGLAEKPPGHRGNGQGRRARGPARRTFRPAARTKALGLRAKTLARALRPAPTWPSRPKPARGQAPVSPGEPTPQLALLFPEELPPEEATVRPPTRMWSQWARWGSPSRIAWLVLVLVLVSAGPLALLLAR